MFISILLLVILIFVNGMFSATEIAFLSINKYHLSKEVKKGNKKAKKIVKLLDDSSSFLSAIQIAITLSGFLASAFAAESFASEIADYINISFLSYSTVENILVILITMILSYFTLVFGELVPKKVGLAASDRIAYAMVDVIDFVIVVCKPFILLLKFSTDIVCFLLGIKEKKTNDEDDIKGSIADSGLEELEKQLLLNIFEFNDVTVSDIMTEKRKVYFVNENMTKEEIYKIVKKSGFTRFPVLNDNDKVVGILNVKDLIVNRTEKFDLKIHIRKPINLKRTMIIDDAFLLLNSKCEGMAIVIDENKEFIGVVTLEDILESVVGNIFDEYDKTGGDVIEFGTSYNANLVSQKEKDNEII